MAIKDLDSKVKNAKSCNLSMKLHYSTVGVTSDVSEINSLMTIINCNISFVGNLSTLYFRIIKISSSNLVKLACHSTC